MKILIADDEPVAQKRLATILQEKLGKDDRVIFANDGLAALTAIEQEHPDIAFLDISMPQLSGIEVAMNTRNKNCKIIFVTAYDQFALQAFDAQAVDYVLKPYSSERLLAAFTRVCQQKAPSAQPALLHNRFVDKVGGSYKIFSFGEISAFTAKGDYIACYAGEKSYLLERTLDKLQQTLPANFQRIHRSTIINLDFLTELRKEEAHTIAVLKDHWHHELPVSRSYLPQLIALLAEHKN